MLLPELLSPTDYAYLILGKAPNKTSVITYVNSGKMAYKNVCVIHAVDCDQDQVVKKKTQRWIKLIIEERILTNTHIENVKKMPNGPVKERWKHLLEESDSLDIPLITQYGNDIKVLEAKWGDKIKNLFKDLGQIPVTKKRIFTTISPSVSDKKEIERLLNYWIRNGQLSQAGKLEQDLRQTILILS